MSSSPKLFQPITVCDCQLSTRIVHAPLTRWRAHDDHTPVDLVIKYYEQRASYPGTLLISEATFISAPAGGFDNGPGIYTDLQIAQWKKVSSRYMIYID
jgi:NADPH2 dehydrogenase